MRNWLESKIWSDRFVPEIQSILGRQFFKVSEPEEDQLYATDLIFHAAGDIKIACRVRRYCYWLNYPNEFTIRAKLPSGRRTELHKIMAGHGDYLFYGFSDENEERLHDWFIGDLKVYRQWMESNWNQKRIVHGMKKENRFGNVFYAFDVTELPKDFIVNRKGRI